MASFSVVALTAAPRNDADITCVRAFIRTDVAFHTNAAALVAIIRVLVMAFMPQKTCKALLSARMETAVFPNFAITLTAGMKPLTAAATASVYSLIWFWNIWSVAEPLLATLP